MESIKGIQVILEDIENNPACPHGPTILFKRIVAGEEQLFYACSACRDRKDCNFFLKAGSEWSKEKQKNWEKRRSETLPVIDHVKLVQRFKQVSHLPEQDRAYCHTCSLLIAKEELMRHSRHDITKPISDHQLLHPSELLKPLESAKKEAQYLFANRSTRIIVDMLRNAGICYVLCLGTPRIHEYIRNKHSSDMKSILLDFDHRYHQFYDTSDFCWFNAFNCHWFDGQRGKAVTEDFLQQGENDQLALVTDPPFGGRVEPLVQTFQRLDQLHQHLHPERVNELHLMWIFPYFMEPMLLEGYSSLKMLDYKVEYENHPLFQPGLKGRKYGSPVRIFTNISPSKLPHPEEDGYRFCDLCEKWVSSENTHCFKCSSCTSKDGRTYVHCDKCHRCVKPTWKHCKTCDRCCLPDHKCGDFKPMGCFACHKAGHKKNDCPLRLSSETNHNANRMRKKRKKKHKSNSSETFKVGGPSSTNLTVPENRKTQLNLAVKKMKMTHSGDV